MLQRKMFLSGVLASGLILFGALCAEESGVAGLIGNDLDGADFNELSGEESAALDELEIMFDAMSPDERNDFIQTTESVAKELDNYVGVEAKKMGITPAQYFETEFLKNFNPEPLLLAQGGALPGAVVSENSFNLPSSGGNKSTAITKPAASVSTMPASATKKTSEEPKKEVATTTKTIAAPTSANYGNWLKKAYYLKEAQKIAATANENIEAIGKQKAEFYSKIMEKIDAELNGFFGKIGVQRGNFAGVIEYLDTVIGQKISAIGLIDKENSGKSDAMDLFLYQIEEKVDLLKNDQQTLKVEMEQLLDLDKKAFDQLEAIEKYVADAHKSYDEMLGNIESIDQTYSHQLAYEFYNKVESNVERINAIYKYLNSTAPGDFEKIKETIFSNLANFEERINKISQEAGKILEKLEKNLAQLNLDRPQSSAGNQKNSSSRASEQPTLSWWQWLLSFFI